MRIQLPFNGGTWYADLSQFFDLSLPLVSGGVGPNCFYAPDFHAEPLVAGNFVGSVAAGAPVNFFNVFLNPHGNGTHTECMGHISDKGYTVYDALKTTHCMARLLSVWPVLLENGDQVVTRESLAPLMEEPSPEALLLRTLPNDPTKRTRRYSGSNPPYMVSSAMECVVEAGVRHLLIDLPSVDRESDGGALEAHKIFWDYPSEARLDCTITEMIYVPDVLEDGWYLLNLQVAPFSLDAAPSRPVAYRLIQGD